MIILIPLIAVSFSAWGSGCLPGNLAILAPDTIVNNVPDTLLVSADTLDMAKKADKFMLQAKIDYASADSLNMDIKNKVAWMYGNASIEYEELKLKAAIIKIDFQNNTVHAYETQDSLGNSIGTPDFTQGDLKFSAKELAYNFTTRKGFIQTVITKEGDGYLHGSEVKKVNDSVTNVHTGEYTTCDLKEHPHFSLKFSRAKVISGNMIVTGPAYMNIEGVPLPLALPFGLFPNKNGRSSGLIIPKYGEAANRGFYLEDGGYYFGISDHFDLKLTGDIYSRGSWALKPVVSYKKRYKYSGNFSIKYAINITGTKGTSDYQKRKDFFVAWSHRQDAKARPNSVFSASVNAGSSSFNKYNPTTVSDYLNNTFSSSVSYDLRLGQFANFTSSARHSQNTSSKTVTLTLPEVSFGISRLYPFKRKVQTGKPAWYESISITYNMNTRNELSTYDSLVFTQESFDRFNTGMKHTIPVSGSFKVLKYFTWSNSISYNERWYVRSIQKTWFSDTLVSGSDTTFGYVETDTIRGFKAARDYSFSSSLSTTFYGMKQFRKGPVKAIRHVVRPSVGFSFMPDFGREQLGYYRTVQVDAEGNTEKYSIFGGSGTFSPLYGIPSSQKSGSLNFSLSNNLEMKVRSKKDTITGTQKIMLIDNLSFSSSYDLARDSLNWSNLSVSGRTTLFKKIQINYGSSYSPYAADSLGRTLNKFQYSVNKKLFRFNNSNWTLSVGYDLTPKKTAKKSAPPASASNPEIEDVQNNPQLYIDWDNPWSLRVDYNFRYSNQYVFSTKSIKSDLIQTFRVSGDINVTPKWKFSMQTGYDFEMKEFAFTQVTIYRNLHCWEMRFSWVPYGTMKSWNFTINAKASILQDLKLTKKKDFRDNY